MRLEEITIGTFSAAIALEVKETQRSFIASNLMTIAQSKFFPEISVKGIFEDDVMVGLVAFNSSLKDEPTKGFVYRFMIDAEYQGRGLGTLAMQLVLDTIKESNDKLEQVTLTVVPANISAKAFYNSLGFVATGVIKEGEEEYLFTVSK
ncbi:MAG: GNAT family N-acetyltransferase [Candidatus Heimdallarchaeota archaeon]|nr:GNAT family N-acetyltransferase [Candidatus Heimdallarchaeota archaeon]